MQPERRGAPRYPAALEIVVSDGSGTTANVSSQGVYFRTLQRLSPDQEILLVFPFEQTMPGARAACSARVLRVDSFDDGYGVAAKYETIGFDVP